MKHILPTDLINKVLSYLSTKAYSEVMGLIEEIKSKAVPIPIDQSDAQPSQSAIESK